MGLISLRATEQIKCGPAMMNLPMTILSVGIGLGYATLVQLITLQKTMHVLGQ